MAYALRVSLSIAIVAMTNGSHPHGWSGSAPHSSYPGFAQDVSGKQMQITERCFPGSVCSCFCMRTDLEAAEKSLEDQEDEGAESSVCCTQGCISWLLLCFWRSLCLETRDFCLTDMFSLLQAPVYNWSTETQGIILSSFFYGYGLTQALGGYCSGLFGGKPVLGSGLLLSSVLTLLMPQAAELGVSFLIGLQVLLGLAEVSRGSRCCQAMKPALVSSGCTPHVPSLHTHCYLRRE